jgi:hypothetical protein
MIHFTVPVRKRPLTPTTGALLLVVGLFWGVSSVLAQSPSAVDAPTTSTVSSVPLHDRLDPKWVLLFEQAYGTAGLYVQEPLPQPGDTHAEIRRELTSLTLLAWRWLEKNPGETPKLERLRDDGLFQEIPPHALERAYTWEPKLGVFSTTVHEEANLLHGAWQQLKFAEDYRRRVSVGDRDAFERLIAINSQVEIPQLLRHEVETRLFAKSQLEFEQVKLLRKVQELLAQLYAAQQKGLDYKYFKDDQQLTLKLVGEFGLIDTLEALPRGGEYVLGTPMDYPKAKFGERVITLSPTELPSLIRRNLNVVLEARPDYPPALAMKARYSASQEGWALINKAVAVWTDCPAFRVQRLAMGFELGRAEHFREDLDYLFTRFPAAPTLLEVIEASNGFPDATRQEWHRAIVEKAVEVRPEVLNFQLVLFALAQGEEDVSTRERVLQKLAVAQPGYPALLR